MVLPQLLPSFFVLFPPVFRFKRAFSGFFGDFQLVVPPLSDNILVLLLDPAEEPDASTVGTRAKVLSPFDADSGGGSQASALRQQEDFAEEHAAVVLVATKKKRS